MIQGGRVIDPATGRDEVCDVRILEGHIDVIGKTPVRAGESVLDARGLVVTPGLVDLCVHLREPGFEEVETIRSGARAALAGGFTSIAAMPDTEPPLDNEASITYVRLKGEEGRAARVYPVGALTQGRLGTHLSEMGGMQRAGAVAFSDEESAVDASDVFLRALRYSAMLDRPILTRCEERSLRGNGVAVSGLLADKLGLPSCAAGTEEVMVERNLRLARTVGTSLHLLHLSTAESLREVAAAKAAGVRVTCSVTPPHLLLTEDLIRDYDSVYRFQPPLQREADRAALVAAVADGTVDAISSHHCPRADGEKNLEFVYAAAGTGGLETAFAVLHTRLVLGGAIGLGRLIETLSTAPARILNLPVGRLAPGAPADVACFDVASEWRIDPARFLSHSRLSPFAGWSVRGRARHVVVGGALRLRDYQPVP